MLSPITQHRCPVCTKASSLTLHNGKHNISTRVGTKYARLLLHYTAGGLISNTWIEGHFFILAVFFNVVKGISDTKPEMNHQNSFYRHNQRPSLYVPNGTGGRDVLYACVLSTMPFRKMWYLRPNWFAMSMI